MIVPVGKTHFLHMLTDHWILPRAQLLEIVFENHSQSIEQKRAPQSTL